VSVCLSAGLLACTSTRTVVRLYGLLSWLCCRPRGADITRGTLKAALKEASPTGDSPYPTPARPAATAASWDGKEGDGPAHYAESCEL
jgi:hypothetical protein